MKFILFCIVLIMITNHNSEAQSPYKSSWKNDGIILGSSIVTAFVASAVDDTLPPLTVSEVNKLSRSSVNWIDRGATYNYSSQLSKKSDILVGLTILAPLSLLFDNDIRNDCGTFALMYLETMTFATFIPSFAKGTIERFRPFVYNPDVAFDIKSSNDPKRSFFSGHTTWAFASAVFFASVYNEYHPDSDLKNYIWGGSLLVAGSIGYLRYRSGAHFVTDILAGAIVGSTIGYIVPLMHRVRMSDISITPIILESNLALSLRLNL